jgi:hypothetical protein
VWTKPIRAKPKSHGAGHRTFGQVQFIEILPLGNILCWSEYAEAFGDLSQPAKRHGDRLRRWAYHLRSMRENSDAFRQPNPAEVHESTITFFAGREIVVSSFSSGIQSKSSGSRARGGQVCLLALGGS